MKKMFFLVAVTVTLSISAFGQINMDNLGRVGIGGAPFAPNRLTVRDQTSQIIGFGTNSTLKWTMGNISGGANVFRFRDETNTPAPINILDLSRGGSYLYTRLTINNDLYANNLYSTNNITAGNTITAPNMNATTSLSAPTLTTTVLNATTLNATTSNTTLSSATNLNASNSVRVNSYGIISRNWSNQLVRDLNPNRPNDPNIGFLFENTLGAPSGYYCDRDYNVMYCNSTFNKILSFYTQLPVWSEKAYISRNGIFFGQSDEKRKENIEPIKSALEKIKNLVGVTYDFIKSDEERMTNDSIINGLIPYAGKIEDFRKNIENKDCGFIAQEIETVIPEVVETSEDGSKFVNYDGVIPFLVEALKEQQAIIESLQVQIQELKGETLKSTLNDPKISEAHKSILNQNTPNPFSQSTVIEYTIAGNAKNAMICIYNMNGNQLKCNPVNPTGHGSIVINGSELSAGMYIYSLIVDGQLIDTKRMVLTN